MPGISLYELSIPWAGTHWKNVSVDILPTCSTAGEVRDLSGHLLFSLVPKKQLGEGTFAKVDEFEQKFPSGDKRRVAVKRPKKQHCNLLLEGLFQWKLYKDLKPYGIQSCVPEVYSIFRYLNYTDAWFAMEVFEPQLLSQWCVKHIHTETSRLFPLLLLQMALILEVFEEALRIDHRDLKVNNLLVLDEPISIEINWKLAPRTLQFPFRIVILDFGFACKDSMYDVKEDDGIPKVSGCPNPGRDFFQILVSLWRIRPLRMCLEDTWGAWIRACIQCANPNVHFDSLIHNSHDLNLLYLTIEHPLFSAPLCTPAKIIQECMKVLDGKK